MNAQKSWRVSGATTMLLAACATTPHANTAANVQGRGVQDPSCLHDTGSRIANPTERCRGFGRSYTDKQIDETGATTVGEALRLLDPSIQVGH
jgi:type 1 fimbria pilin